MLSWPSAWQVGIPVINPELVEEILSWHIKNLDTSQSHLECIGYSCHRGLLSTWHGTKHMMRLMVWWCILLTVKHGNALTVCILTFQLNQGMSVLGCVQMDSTHLGHLVLPILVGRSYSQFITCHWECVWGRSSCFYLLSYPVQAAGAEYRYLSSTIDRWTGAVVVLRISDLWYIEETKFPYKGGFDVDYQWFSSL